MTIQFPSRRLSLSLAAMLAACSLLPAQQTKVLSADKHNEYGLVYSLPVTALEITVVAEKETLIAGPYANYAKKYIGASNPIAESGEKWTIESVYVRPYGAVNPESRYLMQLKPGSTTFISVAHDGMLLSINKELEDNTARGIINQPEAEDRYTGKEYLQFVDEDFIASQSTAKQAEMLSENLMEVRDAYLSLTRGTADTMPVDGKQLELMLSSLKEQQRAMTAAFTGCSYKETVSRTYTYVPEEDTSEVIFRFSDFKGFCGAQDYAGAPVNIRINVTAEGKLPVDANGKEKELPKDAVRYCIPGEAQVTLSFDGRTLYNKEIEFAQFGCEFGLSPALFTDKKQPSYATFNPVTGGLEELGTVKF
ncbi:MAG: DUF4831 family protein [Muribaculaceae bacterium]|nr:DUF4831 family protein [Muribaculaceae bacterium]